LKFVEELFSGLGLVNHEIGEMIDENFLHKEFYEELYPKTKNKE